MIRAVSSWPIDCVGGLSNGSSPAQVHRPDALQILGLGLPEEMAVTIGERNPSTALTTSRKEAGTSMFAENFFRSFFHFWLQTKGFHSFTSGNNMSDLGRKIKVESGNHASSWEGSLSQSGRNAGVLRPLDSGHGLGPQLYLGEQRSDRGQNIG
jgi:hypothetical protein